MDIQKINVTGLTEAENATVNGLLAKLQNKYRRNVLRKTVYDGKRKVEQLADILPPQYKDLSLTVGWCAKAVDLLALRCKLETFTWADGDLDSIGFAEVWDQNMLGAEVHQGLDASLIHSTAFVTTTVGGPGEPDVIWQFHDAMHATGDWNARARRLESLLVLTGWDDEGSLTGFVLYLPNLVIQVSKQSGVWRVVARRTHRWHVPADPLPFGARIGRPFGRSRINRAMLGLQAAAIRDLLRLEGHMDIYSYPEYWLLGADPSIFTNAEGLVQTAWGAMMGRFKGIPDDPAAPDPQTARADVKQFSASSPEPHLAALNARAKLFAREASLPDTSLAITDLANPTSAEAYDASQHDLIAHAEGATDGWSPYMRRSMIRSLGIKNGLSGPDAIPAEWLSIRDKWRDPRYTSRASQADAGTKQLSSVQWLADTEVGLELLGLDVDQRDRALSERRRAKDRSMLQMLIGGADGVSGNGERVEAGAGGDSAAG